MILELILFAEAPVLEMAWIVDAKVYSIIRQIMKHNS